MTQHLILPAISTNLATFTRNVNSFYQKKATQLNRYITTAFQEKSPGISILKTVSTTDLSTEEPQLLIEEDKAPRAIGHEKFAKKVLQYVEDTQVYQQTGLSIAALAQQMNTPSHYLSKIINEQLNCTFIDFINGYRIKAVQEKLQQKEYHHYTILAVAFEAGFNSKSAFYTAFKKYTGTTPSKYRKAMVVK